VPAPGDPEAAAAATAGHFGAMWGGECRGESRARRRQCGGVAGGAAASGCHSGVAGRAAQQQSFLSPRCHISATWRLTAENCCHDIVKSQKPASRYKLTYL